MPDNIYAKFGDLEGSSSDKGFDKWCKLNSVNTCLEATSSGERDTKGGSSVGRAQHNDVEVCKLFDAASTEMHRMMLENEAMDVEIAVVRQTGKSKEGYLKIKLTDCFLTKIDVSAGEDLEGTTEDCSINYGEIEWEFTARDDAGKAAGTTAAGWNRKTNETK